MSIAHKSAPHPEDNEASRTEALLVAVGGAAVLDALGLTREDLEQVRGDADFRRKLEITYGFLVALKEASVLHTFLKLPQVDQSKFLQWLASTDDADIRRSRIESFVSALEASPLVGGSDSKASA